eukprot:3280464-Rhodomonas_salina.1
MPSSSSASALAAPPASVSRKSTASARQDKNRTDAEEGQKKTQDGNHTQRSVEDQKGNTARNTGTTREVCNALERGGTAVSAGDRGLFGPEVLLVCVHKVVVGHHWEDRAQHFSHKRRAALPRSSYASGAGVRGPVMIAGRSWAGQTIMLAGVLISGMMVDVTPCLVSISFGTTNM